MDTEQTNVGPLVVLAMAKKDQNTTMLIALLDSVYRDKHNATVLADQDNKIFIL
jgi:hypothetical protein